MRELVVVLALAMSAACTERNPEFCGDRVCVDPARPYCDYHGDIGGRPATCIAVECSPGEFALCRSDTALSCTASGTAYEETECPLGCDPDASGCRECTRNDECTGLRICDEATSACRACIADDECESRVCDFSTGSCAGETDVVYAAPNVFGTCSLAQPCRLDAAITAALNAATPKTLRMLPGNYNEQFKVSASIAELNVVATGANMVAAGDAAAIVVDGGASVRFRNLASTSELLAQCGLVASSLRSSLTLIDSKLAQVGAGPLMFEIQKCTLTLGNVEAVAHYNVIATRDDATVIADRFHVRATQQNTVLATGSRVQMQFTNSVLQNTKIVGFLSDAGPPGSSLRFAYSTLYTSDGLEICQGPASALVPIIFENTIVAASAAYDAFDTPGAACSFVKTLLSRQSAPPSGTFVANPRFVDLVQGDFHLLGDSPAVDAAQPGTISTDHDLDATPRPHGAAPDVGAYEVHP